MMTSPNGLLCFTNCLLPMEDGSLVEKDLWIDEQRGVVLDSQVCETWRIHRLNTDLALYRKPFS